MLFVLFCFIELTSPSPTSNPTILRCMYTKMYYFTTLVIWMYELILSWYLMNLFSGELRIKLRIYSKHLFSAMIYSNQFIKKLSKYFMILWISFSTKMRGNDKRKNCIFEEINRPSSTFPAEIWKESGQTQFRHAHLICINPHNIKEIDMNTILRQRINADRTACRHDEGEQINFYFYESHQFPDRNEKKSKVIHSKKIAFTLAYTDRYPHTWNSRKIWMTEYIMHRHRCKHVNKNSVWLSGAIQREKSRKKSQSFLFISHTWYTFYTHHDVETNTFYSSQIRERSNAVFCNKVRLLCHSCVKRYCREINMIRV